MRRFKLYREVDVSGISGTGNVAEGVEFSDKSVVLRWCILPQLCSVNFYASIEAVEKIHGHEGNTRIDWIDD
jgi:hypothetical protein